MKPTRKPSSTTRLVPDWMMTEASLSRMDMRSVGPEAAPVLMLMLVLPTAPEPL